MINPIQDPNSEIEAKTKIESIIQNPETRRICLSLLADCINHANSIRRDWWAVTNTKNYSNSIWLQVGNYAVFILENNQAWFALDKQLVDTHLRNDIDFRSPNNYGWTPQVGGLERYKDRFRPSESFSINGYYKPQSLEQHNEIWPKIRRLHFEFIYKASIIGQSMGSDTKTIHLPGVLKYLRNELGQHIPDPLY